MNTPNERSLGETLVKAVRLALETTVQEAVNREAAAAAQRVETAIRAKTAEISTAVLQGWQMNMLGSKLIIQVDLENLHKTP